MADSDTTLKRVEREMLIRTRLMGRVAASMAPLLADLAEERIHAPGEIVCRAGEPPSHVYMLSRGELELTKEGAPPWILEGEGAVGFIDLLLQTPRRHTVRAVTEVHLLRMVGDDYLDFMEDHFEFLMVFVLRAATDLHAMSLALAPDGGFPALAAPTAGSMFPLPPPANLAQKLGALRDSPAFQGANMQALVRLAGLAREVRVNPGDTLFARGEAAGKFFLVATGVVEATREAPALTARFGRGALVCGYGALGQADDHYAATALSPVVAFAFREEDFFDVMEEHFELSRSVLAAIALDFERLSFEGLRRGVKMGSLGGESYRAG